MYIYYARIDPGGSVFVAAIGRGGLRNNGTFGFKGIGATNRHTDFYFYFFFTIPGPTKKINIKRRKKNKNENEKEAGVGCVELFVPNRNRHRD